MRIKYRYAQDSFPRLFNYQSERELKQKTTYACKPRRHSWSIQEADYKICTRCGCARR